MNRMKEPVIALRNRLGAVIAGASACALIVLLGATPAQAREWTHCTSGRVCVYQDWGYEGTYQFWLGTASGYGVLANQVSSLVNRVPNETMFYTNANYSGNWYLVSANGTRENLANYGWNDSIESHRPY